MIIRRFKRLIYLGTCTLLMSAMASCGGHQGSSIDSSRQADTLAIDSVSAINYEGGTIKTRYNVPPKFHRVKAERGSFAEYLQNLPLKSMDTSVHFYDGATKENNIGSAVIDLDLDTVDTQEAIGSIIRLRGEYLYKSGQYDKIRFHLNKNFIADFPHWTKGYRIVKKGNKMSWIKVGKEEDFSYENFRAYLSAVMGYANMQTLEMDLEKIDEEEFGIGTIILSDESPQHAAIVVDMIKMDKDVSVSGWRDMVGVLLAQGDTPAQEIEIIGGNWDEFALFPKHSDFVNYWTTTSYGERFINKQGGTLLTKDKTFRNKKNYHFYDDKISSEEK